MDAATQVAGARRDRWPGVAPPVIPRWVAEPGDGVGRHDVALPAGLDSAAVLAAHARVLASLTGTGEVVIGLRTPGGVLPCRVPVVDGPWWRLVEQAGEARQVTLHDADRPAPGMAFDVVLDLGDGGPGGDFGTGIGTDGAVLLVRLMDSGARLELRYRRDAVDAGYAQRIAGYHLAALRLLIAEPDAEHQRQSLLSGDELRLQVHGMRGPDRPLPDRRAHELFEERVRAHPVAVAASCGGRELSYAELNARANRLAHAMLARGVGGEQVVGVVTERNLDWLACVLAVFKSGAAYLPIEPHFPADRIATMLARSGCRLVLTEPGSTTTLDAALVAMPGVETILVPDALLDGPDPNPGVPVRPDQLAYLYFTSGSTGEPKGAMCEQAGMLNHLFAKIDDLGIGPGQVVAQTAPQCFDISLWQLLAALMVGGRTLIIEQDAVLDVPRFVHALADGRVDVVQTVPSYLDVVLSHLEHHRTELPALRCVSATGEALRKELVLRWFARFPDKTLVNAYGLTETSDDTNHEVMTAPPEQDRVPLGRPVNNVTVYVVDEQLVPVPLGAVGEIVFSGVCVGRGYINDPHRTGLAFLADPHRPGERLYRSGDYGRWLPDGRLEFHGRRDSQVKVHGHRIEIGEIENQLLRVPRLRDGAVVVRDDPERGAHLVAFYTAPPAVPVESIRGWLADTLPEYMVPPHYVWIDTLPLSGNGKIDRKALATIAHSLGGSAPTVDPPRTPAEARLALVWAEVLGVPAHRVSRTDHFFAQGGTSLSALRLVAGLDGAVSIAELTRRPVLADLAAALASGDHSCLQPLQPPSGGTAAALVCFPYAGGNAVNYRAVADALAGSGIAVYAVEPPGQAPTRDGRPFAEVDRLAGQVAAEIVARGLGPVAVWGHSTGAAAAVHTARLIEERGADVRHVFVGAQVPGEPGSWPAMAAAVAARSDDELAGQLCAAATGLDAAHALLAAPAYRHDVLTAGRYLAEPPPGPPLSALLTVVIAADDEDAADQRRHHRRWARFATRVALHELPAGGHYFIHTRAADVADLVLTKGGLA